jgi:two-component system, OmpR family, sensor kinase
VTLGRLSIRARLTAAFAAALVLVLGLAGLFVYLRVASELRSTLDDGLRSRADDLAALVDSAGARPPRLTGGRLVEGEEGFSQILTPDGRVVASTLASGTGSALDPAQLEQAARESVLVDREVPGIEAEARILARPASSADGSFVVVAGASTDDRQEALAGLAGAFLIGAPLALVLASGLGYVLARRSLGPVEAMRRRAREITLERSGERLPLPRAEDEIRQLGETLNTMLDRIEAALERERVFVADASHELRTPLANLRAELDLADRPERTAGELRSALRSASEEVDRLSRLAEDMLVIARFDQGRLPIKRERVDVGALLGRVAERFRRRAGERGREIVVDAPTNLRAELDVLRIEQALGNLTDNALRHGGGQVSLSAQRDDSFVLLEVADHGAGFPPGFAGEAFERFTRGDHGRTGGGAGLGLAIVRAIAIAHGGMVSLASDLGESTTALRIVLPAEAAQREGAPR